MSALDLTLRELETKLARLRWFEQREDKVRDALNFHLRAQHIHTMETLEDLIAFERSEPKP